MKTILFMKALSEDTRLRTFRVLAEAKVALCVAEMSDVLQKPQYAVSRSFIELRKAGLLSEDRQGKFVYYSLVNEDPVHELGNWVQKTCVGDVEPAPRNRDGSSAPGGHRCAYDTERLGWRLSLREADKVPVTHNARTEPQDPRPRVLFVCTHNSARSQLAEEYLRQFAGERFFVESAGLTPGVLNPHVVGLLKEEGIDITRKPTQAVGDLFRKGATYHWVITVCSREAEENCPVFPGPVRRLSWPFPDPAGFLGTEEDVQARVRRLATEIRSQVKTFVSDNLAPDDLKEKS